jgi:hypothetical protein
MTTNARAVLAVLFLALLLALPAATCGNQPTDITGQLCGRPGTPMSTDTAGMPYCEK